MKGSGWRLSVLSAGGAGRFKINPVVSDQIGHNVVRS